MLVARNVRKILMHQADNRVHKKVWSELCDVVFRLCRLQCPPPAQPGLTISQFADWNFCRLPGGGGLLIGRVSPVGGSQQPFMVALMGGGPGEERGTWPITSYQPHLQHSRHKRNRKSALNGTEKPWSTLNVAAEVDRQEPPCWLSWDRFWVLTLILTFGKKISKSMFLVSSKPIVKLSLSPKVQGLWLTLLLRDYPPNPNQRPVLEHDFVERPV